MSQNVDHYKVVALYNFVSLPDCENLREPLLEFCRERGIRGTLILAPEGINGTIAGTPQAIQELIALFKTNNRFGGILDGAEVKYSSAKEMPFLRLKVRIKSEIVTLKAPEADPNKTVGTYVAPQEWNRLLEEDDLVLLDTRNDYEFALGTFEGARDPNTKTFSEFKDYVAQNLDPARDKKVAMFCTGGIRCEKASSYMKSKGFENVYHLKGGILKYLEEVPDAQSKWNGECFVFDERVSVGHGLVEGEAQLCRACRFPLTPADRAHPDYIEGEQCPHCSGPEFAKMRATAAERQKQMKIAQERGIAHLGDDAVNAARARAKAKKQSREQDRLRNLKSEEI